MADIHVLDSGTIDRIAAGEVVERPSSVVKELVENAIDAGADAITVEAKEGGIEFIRVTDNGCGIEKEQLKKAFLRHATSKIDTADDLQRLVSLGFRGEALSSIAAVSKVELITKRPDKLTGTRIILEGAVEKEFSEIGAPDGTTFLMRNLFFNTPARRKFLKQPATEGGYISDLMEHLALSRPDISFKFVINNKLRFHTTGNGDLREVIYRVYGREIAESLVPVHFNENGIEADGYLGKPVIVRSNRNFEIYFLNSRFIKSNVVYKAIEEGYKEYLMQHKFPLCILHLKMDPQDVDVNVHPSKMDVRFSDNIRFATTMSENIRLALKSHEMIPGHVLDNDADLRREEQEERRRTERQKTPEPFENKRNSEYRVMEEAAYGSVIKTQDFLQKPIWTGYSKGIKEEKNSFWADKASDRIRINDNLHANNLNDDNTDADRQDILNNVARQDFDVSNPSDMENEFFVETKDPWGKDEYEGESRDDADGNKEERAYQNAANANFAVDAEYKNENQCETGIKDGKNGEDGNGQEPEIVHPEQMNLFEERMISVPSRSKYRVVGQVFDTYWIVQYGGDKMFMIDQHAAHEKVKYERFMKRFREKDIVSQNLFPPIILTLSGQEETILKQYADAFGALGFEVEEFGGNEYSLRSVPVDLYGCNEKELFLAVLDELSEMPGKGSFQVIEEKIASMSCKAAVKGGNILSFDEANELIDELLTLENPYNCPHGRPTIITMSKYEMEKKFKRIVG